MSIIKSKLKLNKKLILITRTNNFYKRYVQCVLRTLLMYKRIEHACVISEYPCCLKSCITL